MTLRSTTLPAALSLMALSVVVAQQPTPPAAPTPQQPTAISGVIRGDDPNTQPRIAIPAFVALSSDRETQEAARVVSEVLWSDIDYEHEFYMIPRDVMRSIPAPTSIGEPAYDRWREVGADGLLLGSIQKTGNEVRVEMRLYNVSSRQQLYGREYSGSIANPRLYAHTIADEVHQSQRQVRGVARTKLTFSSDRDKQSVAGTVEKRDVKEIYYGDYDGANQRRVTMGKQLNITPVWSPNGRAIVYTSYRSGFPDVYISFPFDGVMETPAKGRGQNWLPVYSPDGTKIAFTSNRDGNPELYVMNVDGSNVRRLTNHPQIDTTPTWSPNGTQLAFTSDRSGSPAIYVIDSDGLGLRRISNDAYADRPTWSPPPLNELAYAARTGPGYDIKVLSIAAGETRQITFGEGSNESPAWAPNGRHLAFTSTRAGRTQVFTVDRDGKNVRQITREGNNYFPNWSQ